CGIPFPTRPETLQPSLRCRPASELRYCLGALAVVQVNPGSREAIKITAQAKTSAGPLERLRFRSRAGVVIVGPFFSCCGMLTQRDGGSVPGAQQLRRT